MILLATRIGPVGTVTPQSSDRCGFCGKLVYVTPDHLKMIARMPGLFYEYRCQVCQPIDKPLRERPDTGEDNDRYAGWNPLGTHCMDGGPCLKNISGHTTEESAQQQVK